MRFSRKSITWSALPEQLRELVVARPRTAHRGPRRVGEVERDLEQAVFPRAEPDAVSLLDQGTVPAPPGHQPLPGMVSEHTDVALTGGIVQGRFTADRLVDAHGGVEGPRHQRQCRDRLPTERQ